MLPRTPRERPFPTEVGGRPLPSQPPPTTKFAEEVDTGVARQECRHWDGNTRVSPFNGDRRPPPTANEAQAKRRSAMPAIVGNLG